MEGPRHFNDPAIDSSAIEDPDILDSQLLSDLERLQELIKSGQVHESDIDLITNKKEHLKEALFRDGAFCASDIALILSYMLREAAYSSHGSYIEKSIREFYEDNISRIEQHLAHASMASNEGFYDLVYTYIEVCNPSSEESKHILLNNIDRIISQLKVRTTVSQMISYLSVFTIEESREYNIDTRIDTLLREAEPSEFASIVSACLLLPRDVYLRHYGEQALSQKINSYGLDPVVVMGAWKRAGFFHSYAYDAIKQLCSLEDRIPGCTSVLYKDFGILDFHRYPLELLLDQYENRDNLNIPYGVILYPRADGNGAFARGEKVFSSMYAQLKHIYTIRVSECDTKKDVARMLLALDQKYGSEHKIEFMVIGGHGTKDAISFGGTHESHRLRLFDLKHEKISGTKSFFEHNPSIILHSCETGQGGGVAEELSRVLQGKVIAPDTKTVFKEINATVDEEGKPMFSVMFRDGHTRVYNKGTLES